MMHRHRGSRSAIGVALLVSSMGACEPTTVPTTSRIHSIATDWVAPASAPVGSILAEPLRVRVTDETGRAVAGARVVFTVTRGRGSVQYADTITGADGVAGAGSWTLGSAAGTQEVLAHLPLQSNDALAAFRVLTTPGAPATMQISPAVVSLSSGDSVGIAVSFRDALGNVTSAAAASTLASSDSAIVRIQPNGFLRAVSRGLAQITVTNGALARTVVAGVRSGAPVLTVEQVAGPDGDLMAINGARIAYIAHSLGNTVKRFDLATRTATGTVTLSAPVTDVAFLPAGDVLYAATSDSMVHVIDVIGNLLMRSFRAPARVLRLLPTPDGVWVLASTNSNASAFLRISTVNDVMTTATVSGTPRDAALSLDGSRSYVVSSNSQLHEVRTEPFAFVRSVIISNAANSLDITSGGTRILIAALSDSIDMRARSDLTRMRAASPGAAALRIADTPDGHYAISINSGNPEVRILDAYTLQSYASQAAIQPGRIVFDRVANEAWIASAAGLLLRLVIMPPP